MTINQKFLIYSLSVLVVITLMVGALLFTVVGNERTLKFNYENVTVTSTQLFEISSSVRAVPFLMAAVVADMYAVAGARARIVENTAVFNKEFNSFKERMDKNKDKMDEKTKKQYAILIDYMGKLNVFVSKVVVAYEADKTELVEDYLNDGWPDVQPPLYRSLNYFVKYFKDSAESTYSKAVSTSKLYFILAVVFGALVLTIMVIGTFVFARSIIKPVTYIVNLLNSSSKNLTNTSVQMLDASNRLASSSDEQAAATQESVASMQKMASMIDQTSGHSKSSEQVTGGVIQMTQKGDEIMNDMVGAMKEIQDENQKMKEVVDIFNDISRKTNVINDIVFKTQLLSFNASIEAARAGQHGKGFAVVAEEVGSLAAMSGTAAQEIHTLLEDSHKRVQTTVNGTDTVVSRGNKVVDDAQSIFKQIAESIQEINQQIKKIVEASDEQSKGVEQTEAALNQLDSTARENADIATKAHTYSNELSRAKDQLIDIMGQLNSLVNGLNATEKTSGKKSIENIDASLALGGNLDAAELENDFLDTIDHKKVNSK